MAVSASPQHPSRNKAPAAVHPYGLWPSPIDSEQVARQATAYDAVHASGEAVHWLETRPSQDGRAVVVRWTDDAGAADAVPAEFDVGSRVHEYGGGAYLPAGRTLFACSQSDQRLYRIDGQRDPVPITPAPSTPVGLRYADLRLLSSGELLVCVYENAIRVRTWSTSSWPFPPMGRPTRGWWPAGMTSTPPPVPALMVAALPG
jgi:hypothetical protein